MHIYTHMYLSASAGSNTSNELRNNVDGAGVSAKETMQHTQAHGTMSNTAREKSPNACHSVATVSSSSATTAPAAAAYILYTPQGPRPLSQLVIQSRSRHHSNNNNSNCSKRNHYSKYYGCNRISSSRTQTRLQSSHRATGSAPHRQTSVVRDGGRASGTLSECPAHAVSSGREGWPSRRSVLRWLPEVAAVYDRVSQSQLLYIPAHTSVSFLGGFVAGGGARANSASRERVARAVSYCRVPTQHTNVLVLQLRCESVAHRSHMTSLLADAELASSPAQSTCAVQTDSAMHTKSTRQSHTNTPAMDSEQSAAPWFTVVVRLTNSRRGAGRRVVFTPAARAVELHEHHAKVPLRCVAYSEWVCLYLDLTALCTSLFCRGAESCKYKSHKRPPQHPHCHRSRSHINSSGEACPLGDDNEDDDDDDADETSEEDVVVQSTYSSCRGLRECHLHGIDVCSGSCDVYLRRIVALAEMPTWHTTRATDLACRHGSPVPDSGHCPNCSHHTGVYTHRSRTHRANHEQGMYCYIPERGEVVTVGSDRVVGPAHTTPLDATLRLPARVTHCRMVCVQSGYEEVLVRGITHTAITHTGAEAEGDGDERTRATTHDTVSGAAPAVMPKSEMRVCRNDQAVRPTRRATSDNAAIPGSSDDCIDNAPPWHERPNSPTHEKSTPPMTLSVYESARTAAGCPGGAETTTTTTRASSSSSSSSPPPSPPFKCTSRPHLTHATWCMTHSREGALDSRARLPPWHSPMRATMTPTSPRVQRTAMTRCEQTDEESADHVNHEADAWQPGRDERGTVDGAQLERGAVCDEPHRAHTHRAAHAAPEHSNQNAGVLQTRRHSGARAAVWGMDMGRDAETAAATGLPHVYGSPLVPLQTAVRLLHERIRCIDVVLAQSNRLHTDDSAHQDLSLLPAETLLSEEDTPNEEPNTLEQASTAASAAAVAHDEHGEGANRAAAASAVAAGDLPDDASMYGPSEVSGVATQTMQSSPIQHTSASVLHGMDDAVLAERDVAHARAKPEAADDMSVLHTRERANGPSQQPLLGTPVRGRRAGTRLGPTTRTITMSAMTESATCVPVCTTHGAQGVDQAEGATMAEGGCNAVLSPSAMICHSNSAARDEKAVILVADKVGKDAVVSDTAPSAIVAIQHRQPGTVTMPFKASPLPPPPWSPATRLVRDCANSTAAAAAAAAAAAPPPPINAVLERWHSYESPLTPCDNTSGTVSKFNKDKMSNNKSNNNNNQSVDRSNNSHCNSSLSQSKPNNGSRCLGADNDRDAHVGRATSDNPTTQNNLAEDAVSHCSSWTFHSDAAVSTGCSGHRRIAVETDSVCLEDAVEANEALCRLHEQTNHGPIVCTSPPRRVLFREDTLQRCADELRRVLPMWRARQLQSHDTAANRAVAATTRRTAAPATEALPEPFSSASSASSFPVSHNSKPNDPPVVAIDRYAAWTSPTTTPMRSMQEQRLGVSQMDNNIARGKESDGNTDNSKENRSVFTPTAAGVIYALQQINPAKSAAKAMEGMTPTAPTVLGMPDHAVTQKVAQGVRYRYDAMLDCYLDMRRNCYVSCADVPTE